MGEAAGSRAKRSCQSPEEAQACFILALLYSSAPCWMVLRACMSEGGTPLSRKMLACFCFALAPCSPCPEQHAVKRSGVAGCGGGEAMRLADGLLLKTKALLYPRALFFPCFRITDKALCTFWSRSGSIHGAACSVLAEQRRNEASSSRAGGRRLAVHRYHLATSGWRATKYSSAG